MAEYKVERGQVGAYSKTLEANKTDSVLFASEPPSVEVTNWDVSAPLYFTLDGNDPTVGGADTYEVPPAYARVVDVPNQTGKPAVTVKVKSASAVKYSVCRVAG